MNNLDISTAESREALFASLKEHCANGVRRSETRNDILIGAGGGNEMLVFDIVCGAIRFTNQLGFERLRSDNQSLADYVAVATISEICDKFTWDIASAIILKADRIGIKEPHVQIIESKRYHAVEHTLGYMRGDSPGGVKRMVMRLARTILWLEAYTFLLEHGYNWNENENHL